MNEPIGIGVVGCGASVWMHGPAINANRECRLVGWYDPVPEAARRAVDRNGGTAFESLEDLLERSDLDAVIVASPPQYHLEQAREATRLNKDILCEKPLATSLAEAREFVAIADGRVFQVGFMKRFDQAFVQAKELAESGELGEVYQFTVDWGWPQYFGAGWRDTASTGGGLLMDHGSHTVDLSRWFLGDVSQLYATVQSRLEGREVDDHAVLVCTHESGRVSVHHHSRLGHRSLRECYRIDGSRASLEIVSEGKWTAAYLEPFRLFLHRSGTGISSTRAEITPSHLSEPIDSRVANDFRYTRQLAHFLACVRSRRSPEHGAVEDGIATMDVLEAAYISSAEGRAVSIPVEASRPRGELLAETRRYPRFPAKG